MTEPRFWFVALDVPEADADERGAALFELGATGVEQRDATTLLKGAAAGTVTLVASFDGEEDANAAKDAMLAEDPSCAARLEVVVGDAWRDEYKKYFHPFVLCPGLVVRPPWEERDAGPGERVLVLEPGRAFGTGLHETTSLVAEVLSAHAGEVRGAEVLDAGCGSGILALVALAFGAERARAVDVDPDAIAVTRENAERNGMQARVEADTTEVAALGRAWPVVVANIEAVVLEPMAPDLSARVAPGGLLVLSGVLATQADRVRACYTQSFDDLETRAKGEWVALVLRKRR